MFRIIEATMPTPVGLCSQYFTRTERRLLERFPTEDGLSELNLLRVLLARTLGAASRLPRRNLGHQAALLAALSRTAANIAALARLRAGGLTTADDPVLDAFAALDLADL